MLVQRKTWPPCAHQGGHVFRCTSIDVSDQDVRSGTSESLCQLTAKACTRARDEGDLLVDLHRNSSLAHAPPRSDPEHTADHRQTDPLRTCSWDVRRREPRELELSRLPIVLRDSLVPERTS